MRRKPILSLLLAFAILGGMLALFPTPWMMLGILLLVLVTTQVILVRRHLYRLPASLTRGMPPVEVAVPRSGAPGAGTGSAGSAAAAGASPEPRAAAVPPNSDSTAGPSAPAAAKPAPADDAGSTPAADPAPAAPAAEPAPEAPSPAGANIDAALFSRFRKHLEQAEAQTEDGPPKPPVPLEDTEVEDRVDLSRRVRPPAAARPPGPPRPPPEPKARPKPAPPAESDEEDLFADLRPTPPPAPKPPPAAAPPAPAGTATGRPVLTPSPEQGLVARPRPQDAEPAPADAPGAAGSASPAAPAAAPGAPGGRAAPDEGLADEAEALLHMAEEAAGREDWDALHAGLDNYLAHLADAPELIHWRARRLQARLAVHDRDANGALQGFEEMLSAGYRPTMEETPALLDSLLAGADPAAAASLRVSMLVRILAGFRQARDQAAMDRCYGWIEEAQEQVGDERRLLQYLKNHLEIRKVLGDLPGQLELIDQLGNRCYRLGLTEDAKVYYEMGLRLRAEAERSGELAPEPAEEPAAGEDGPQEASEG